MTGIGRPYLTKPEEIEELCDKGTKRLPDFAVVARSRTGATDFLFWVSVYAGLALGTA